MTTNQNPFGDKPPPTLDECNWKEVSENFWYACNEGDTEMIKRMLERYEQYFNKTPSSTASEETRTKGLNKR
jgi:hypothetical protein